MRFAKSIADAEHNRAIKKTACAAASLSGIVEHFFDTLGEGG